MITINEHHFMIENYQSVLYLSNNKIIIQLKKNKIEILGKDFTLDYYSNVEIRGRGCIDEVRYIH